MKRRGYGFTLVELLITIVVMVILMTLAVVSFGNAQPAARDKERQADVEALARALEQRYELGSPVDPTAPKGSYISTDEFAAIEAGSADNYRYEVLRGTTKQNFESPKDQNAWKVSSTNSSQNARTASVIQAAFGGSPYQDKYVYEPVSANGRICTTSSPSPCTRYTIYWIKETESASQLGIPGLQIYESRRQ